MILGKVPRNVSSLRLATLVCALASAVVASSFATVLPCLADDNWPSFLNGGSSQIQADGVPSAWSPTKNIAWRSAIPGYGQSAPVIWGDTAFLTSSDGAWQERGLVHAYSLASGKKLWTSTVPSTMKVENYFRNSRAAPTCVVDSEGVVSFFPSGDVTSMTHEGKTTWTVPLFKEFGLPINERGTASSLAQTDENIFVLVDHGGPSYVVALRKADGEIAWKADRGNRIPSWSSPVIYRRQNRDILLVSSADTVDAYNAESGEKIWEVDGLQGNHIPSATVVGDSMYVGSTELFHGKFDPGRVAGSNCRIDLQTGNTSEPYRVRWGAERANSYYSSPLAFAGYVYYVNKAGVLYCCDAETGKRLYTKRLDGPCWASAIGVTTSDRNRFIYFVSKNGKTTVIRPGETYDEVSKNQLWDEEELRAAADLAREQREKNRVPAEEAPTKSGPEAIFIGLPESALHGMFSYGDPIAYAASIVDGSILIRTGQHLYCIRQASR